MYSFVVSRDRRANVWLDEAPAADFTPSSVFTRIVKSKGAVDVVRRIAAIEISIHLGPKTSYALLGAELVASEADGLEVVVPVNPVGLQFAPSLALKPDEVLVGMPDEYVGAVFTGVERAVGSIGLPIRMSLRFRWAAHGLVGSSRLIFEKASGLVVQLLTLPEDASERHIVALFD